jgi:hypothetical protein
MQKATMDDMIAMRRTWTKVRSRGYYLLLTSCICLAILTYVLIKAVLWMWGAKTDSDSVRNGAEFQEVPSMNPDVQEIMRRVDMDTRYTLHNAKLDEMRSRGALARSTAEDAKRTKSNMFRRDRDTWSAPQAPVGENNAAFNPNVTLIGH